MPLVPPKAIFSESVLTISNAGYAYLPTGDKGAAIGPVIDWRRARSFQQTVEIAFIGKRGADVVQIFDAAKEVVKRSQEICCLLPIRQSVACAAQNSSS
ncbi:MAG: hypothetical protein HT580_10710 [Dechloromonas sp.]|nr:MAG: hypothetical protein HT580_10710 [Dechloromonas sp.]